jgi:dihydrofolate reductase
MKINIIVAYSNNYIIGNDNNLPWNYKEDLEYFKTITSHTRKDDNKNAIIMGYNTWLSIKKKLKNRINIVITTKIIEKTELEDNDLFFVDSMGSAIDVCKDVFNSKKIENIFIIGGEKIYTYFFRSYFYTYIDKIYITKINKDFEGNKYFPNIDNKFYYTQISTSYENPELEYRVLQYNKNYIHPDNKYVYYLKKIFERNNEYGLQLKYDIKSYFPLITILNIKNIQLTLEVQKILDNDNIKIKINEIIDKINNKDYNDLTIKLLNNNLFKSNYYFIIDNDNISCVINQEYVNIITDIPYSIILGGIIIYIISFITKKERNLLIYSCVNSYVLEENKKDYTDDIIWNNSKPLPLLEINDNNQQNINDIKYDDIHFLGID